MSLAPLSLVISLGLAQAMPDAEVAAARKLEKEASELQRAGRYADAEKPLQAAIALWTRYRGPDDVEVLNDTMNLAVARRRQGDPAAAVPLLEKAVNGLARCPDPDAPELRRRAINNLAMAYRYSGRARQAQAAWQGLLPQLAGEAQAEERARVLDNLSTLLLDDLQDVAGAERYARQGHAAWKALRGDGDDPDVAISESILGSIAITRGDLQTARKLLEHALHVHQTVTGPDTPNVAASLNLIARLELAEGHRDAARADYRRSLEISRKLQLGPRHQLVVEAQDGLKKLDAAGR